MAKTRIGSKSVSKGDLFHERGRAELSCVSIALAERYALHVARTDLPHSRGLQTCVRGHVRADFVADSESGFMRL
jgi:hypothetical protein